MTESIETPGSSAARGRNPMAYLPIGLVVLLGAGLRIAQIDQSFITDEMWSYHEATLPTFGGMLDFVRGDEEITPPLFTILAWLAGRISDSAEVLRLPSLLSGIVTIPIVYAIGDRTLGRRVAVTAAVLAALSPFLTWFSIELRAYSLAIMFVSLSTLCLLLAVEDNRFRWWACYAAASCAAMYTHYTSAYVLLAQLAWVLVLVPASRRPVLLANVAAAVAFLPWLPGLIDDLGSPSQGIIGRFAPFGWHNAVAFTGQFAFANPAFTVRDYLGLGVELALFLGLAVGAVGAVIGWRGRGQPGDAGTEPSRTRDLVLLVAVACAAPVCVALVSLLSSDQFLPRNLATSAPGLLICIAALLCAGPLVTRVVSTVLVVGAFAFGAVRGLDPDYQRMHYDEAGSYIDATVGPDDVVLDIAGLGGLQADGEPIPAFDSLDIQLRKPHQIVDSATGEEVQAAYTMAAGSRLFLVGTTPLVELIRSALELDGEPPVEQRSFEGSMPLLIEAFDIPHGATAPGPTP